MSTGKDQGSGSYGGTDQHHDDAYELDRKSVAAILYAVDVQDKDQLTRLMAPLHAADIADLLEQINTHDRARLLELFGLSLIHI